MFEDASVLHGPFDFAEVIPCRPAIRLQGNYPVKVRPIPGMFVQSVPVTDIPLGGMKAEQHDLLDEEYPTT
jgi:hypothetical protein